MRLRFNHYRFLFVLCLLCSAQSSFALLSENTVVRSAKQQAEELQLAQHETWLALLHYKRETLLRRSISQADDERFFLDENGRTDPQAELFTNIDAFLQKSAIGHAQCLFPARWWWLKQQLKLSDEFDVPCPKLEAFMKRVSHDKLFLVFPSMYMNNPGSMFGHTFLRFDADEESILLSQTLNYAARVDQSDDFVSYISKGLMGGYKGFFRARAYFETVQEYSNIENRDIWEYLLDFSPDEIEQLVRHVWEVKGIDFDYYFFRENCSYRLLALLDVIRPNMQLTGEDQFPVYAIPVDTVRALEDENLIRSREFRASLATQIDDYFFTDENAAIVLQIVAQETTSDKELITKKLQGLTTAAEKRGVLRQSYNILQYYGKSSSAKAQLVLQLISELPAATALPESGLTHSEKISPEKGHDSMRVAAGYGEQNSQKYIDLRIRPAFHDLLDAPQGYVNGAAINVFDTRFKWFEGNKLRLESLSIFNVTSLMPLRRWQKPLSWLFDFRFDRTQLSDTRSARNFTSRGGAGLSFRHQSLLPFALVMGEWQLASSYDKGFSLLLGLQLGLKYNFRSSQLMLSYEKDEAVSGFDLDRAISRLQWQYNLQVNHAVRLNYRRTEYDFYNDEDWSLDYNYYF